MLLHILWVIGITAEGVTGALAAGRMRMDLFGVSTIACMTAIGGGTLRDVILGHYPLVWVASPQYLLVIVGAALITVLLADFLMKHFRVVFLVADAIGLSAFSIIGARVAMEMGHGVIIAIVGAVLTGAFGGVLRDLMCDRVPLVFQRSSMPPSQSSRRRFTTCSTWLACTRASTLSALCCRRCSFD